MASERLVVSSDRVRRLCRESEEKLKNRAEEKADEAVEAAQETVEQVLDEQLDQQLETACAESLDMEEDTAEAVGIMLAKVVVVSDSCARQIQGVHNVCPNPSFARLPRMPLGTAVLHAPAVQ